MLKPEIECLEEESEDLSSEVFSPGFLVIHDAAGSRHDDVAERKEKLLALTTL
jgi:hypothetical protein